MEVSSGSEFVEMREWNSLELRETILCLISHTIA